MDKETRNRIQRATQAARSLLEEEYREQLEGTFDILLDGTIAAEPGGHLDATQRVVREKLVATVAHKRSTGLTRAEAVDTYLREAAFTTLNRFVALKMLEARQLVQQCVSKGEESSGFAEFKGLAGGLEALPDKGYRLFIETIFDELGREVRVLFDRRDVTSLLWPRRQALLALLDLLNADDLDGVWGEDETIGWVYQYFNSDDERRKMRDESSAPRNSRELAVRNQFFTPRYVVQFLTDNTLGRTWYEMMQGETALRDLDYLVRRPNEIFLAEGVEPPTEDTSDTASPEARRCRRCDAELESGSDELCATCLADAGEPPPPPAGAAELADPHHVRFRPKKDPRDLRILDPACGSGHFLLYAFDLLITIYQEAWADPDAAAFTGAGHTLREDYADLDALQRAIPGLVLRHNLHGVDIDPRAAQIAALALWMRTQRAYNEFDISPGDRPPVQRTNIVVAEPMPGDRELVEEFAATLQPRVLGDLFKRMVDEMKLAGELGSLLKLEEALANAVRNARKQFVAWQQEQKGFLPGLEPARRQRKIDFSDLDDARFFEQAEQQIVDALARFAVSASGGGGVQRRLFAGDAMQGVAFFEQHLRPFDVVLMNPPFGDASERIKAHIDTVYPYSRQDLFAPFVERALELSPRGRIGVLTADAGFFRRTLEAWRRNVLLARSTLQVFAHLGDNILDSANVRVAAYCLIPPLNACRTDYVRAVSAADRESREPTLRRAITGLRGGAESADMYCTSQSEFEKLPYAVFGYWCSADLRNAFVDLPNLEEANLARVRQGLATADDFRFLRLRWEVASKTVGPSGWMPFAKGGEYSPYHDDVHLALRWVERGKELIAWGRGRPQNIDIFGKPGLTYPRRTAKRFAPRLLPRGCAFGDKGPAVVDVSGSSWSLLALLNSRTLSYLLSLGLGMAEAKDASNSYEVGLVQRLPVPWAGMADETLEALSRRAWHARADLDLRDETTALFVAPFAPLGLRDSIDASCNDLAAHLRRHADAYLDTQLAIDERVVELYEFSSADWTEIEAQGGELHIPEVPLADDVEFRVETCTRLVLFLVGAAFGRWDSQRLLERFDPLVEADAFAGVPLHHDVSATGPSSLVDDPGAPTDVTALIRAALQRSGFPDPVRVLDEAAEILDPRGRNLREWLAKRFFECHIKRYSKSRRKAPIYWQLGTPSASYSVWLYYHRLTRDTMFRALNDHVVPKVEHETRKLATMRQEAGPSPSAGQRRDIEAQEGFVAELNAFKDEVARVAPLFNPDLNDGVAINFAPLWRMVSHHRQWQTYCKKIWDTLVAGEYDWAHLAMHLWPERVVPKCATDRSLAIAHDLEDVFWLEDDDGNWHKRTVAPDTVDELIAERTSRAVKDALEKLLAAPAPRRASGRRRGRSRGRSGGRRQRASSPAPAASVDEATLEAVKAAIADADGGARKSDVVDATGLSDADWNAARTLLVERGEVTSTGRGRGVRYFLADAAGG